MNDYRFVGTRSGMEVTNLFTGTPSSPSADELRRWCLEHLSRPHPELGRRGPVCPFTSPAITRGSLWSAFVSGSDVATQNLTEIVDDLFELFPDLPPQDEPDSRFKAVMVAFPELTDYSVIDTIQLRQKTRFVDHGLMLGQFYPGCTVPGLRNPDFPALDAPLPMLAVRHMVSTDLPFLDTRPDWLDAYHRQFTPVTIG